MQLPVSTAGRADGELVAQAGDAGVVSMAASTRLTTEFFAFSAKKLPMRIGRAGEIVPRAGDAHSTAPAGAKLADLCTPRAGDAGGELVARGGDAPAEAKLGDLRTPGADAGFVARAGDAPAAAKLGDLCTPGAGWNAADGQRQSRSSIAAAVAMLNAPSFTFELCAAGPAGKTQVF